MIAMMMPDDDGYDSLEGRLADDVWDARLIPGLRCSPHESQHLLRFDKVPQVHMLVMKRYMRFKVTHCAFQTCFNSLRYAVPFVQFYHARNPDAVDFKLLTRADVEAYLFVVRTTPLRGGKPSSKSHLWERIKAMRNFLNYMERSACPEAPLVPVSKLVWPDDSGGTDNYGRNKGYGSPSHIPESVLRQLDAHLDKLPATVIPIVTLLRASGWRISDVLNLRYDKCLEAKGSKWWLCGDIVKTGVRDHKVRITKDVAAIVECQREFVTKQYKHDDNPTGFLFPATVSLRYGRPYSAAGVRIALKRLALNYNIRDDAGNIFHFKLHAFRHTKGVELVNAGMSLLSVQRWLAHVSPEMTLRYARLLDTTVEREWEQVFENGGARLDEMGSAQPASRDALLDETLDLPHVRANLDRVRLPLGYCFKPTVAFCPNQFIPCYSCPSFATTPEFLPQFKKLEQDTLELIEMGEQTGKAQWVERNKQHIIPIQSIIGVLQTGTIVNTPAHDPPAGGREE